MARLRRTSPDQPGWTRRRAGRGFVYLDEHGARLPEEDAQRVRDLVIPPAWTRRLGHAVRRTGTCRPSAPTTPAGGSTSTTRTGGPGGTRRSSTGCWSFGKALTRARELVVTDLGREGMPLERACAAAVRLLDLGYFRIGNDVYADENGSFGLTTLERRHVRRHQDRLVFAFVGKSGVEHEIEIDDRVVIEAIDVMRRRRGERPAAAVLQGRPLVALGAARRWSTSTSASRTGLEATAKDFRTWHATVLAAAALAETPEPGETEGVAQAGGRRGR